ncbi:MAG: hypothetical protein Q9222_003506 [Ikaeria aurantiellina]
MRSPIPALGGTDAILASPRDPQAGTTAVGSQYIRLTTIHGRDFQKYSIDHAIQFVPADEEEADRLEAQHRIFNIVFDGRLFFPPVARVRSVLDCGYGAASWAIEVAENDPSCTVIGIDISLHMKPDDMPDNFSPQSINGVKDPRAPLQLQALLANAGFTSIETNMVPLPTCVWGSDVKQRRVGEAMRTNVDNLLRTVAIFPFTRRLGMSIDAVDDLVSRARLDAANAHLKPYFPL